MSFTLLPHSVKPSPAEKPFGLDQLSLTGKLRNLSTPSATSQIFGILVAGNELSMVEEIARALERHWFPIHQAVGGSQAVIVATARQPMAAIIDFTLRDQNGTASCLQIKHACPGMQIVVTATPENVQQARDAGFVALTKPIDIPDLVSILQRLAIGG